MEIPIGASIIKLLEMRKKAEGWDPHGQMPWSDETIVKDENGKKYKVVTTLNPKEEINVK